MIKYRFFSDQMHLIDYDITQINPTGATKLHHVAIITSTCLVVN